jgi:hypothetical protein
VIERDVSKFINAVPRPDDTKNTIVYKSFNTNGEEVDPDTDEKDVFAKSSQLRKDSPKYWIRVDAFKMPLKVYDKRAVASNSGFAKTSGFRETMLLEVNQICFSGYVNYLRTGDIDQWNLARSRRG